MQEIRQALAFGLNIITVFPKDNGESFDSFIGTCPADLKTGNIHYDGQELKCPGLFESIAVEWFEKYPEYQPTCSLLMLQQLRETLPSETAGVCLQDLEGQLAALGSEKASNAATVLGAFSDAGGI
jgi:hypothetical protein